MKNNTVFVLLAGGQSQRMGIPKGLLKFKSSYWILEQLNRIAQTEISKVYIGLGHGHQEYFQAIPWFETAQENFVKYLHLDIKIVINTSPEKGSFSTLQSVLTNIPHVDVIMNPIDVPLLNSIAFNQIYSENNTVVIPNYEGKNGHPIKLSASFCETLVKLDNRQETARLDLQIKRLKQNKISTINILDPSILKNLNNQETWNLFLSQDQIASNFYEN